MQRAQFRLAELPLLFAIFLDLVGFGMAFPDIQLRAEKLGAPGWLIGALLASYFVTQVLVSPHWGRLSDRIGRKPVLLVCTALSITSMVAYALVTSLIGILISRILAGFAAANVVVAQAYIADTSTEEDRAAKMGRVGAAITTGLIAGPALGGHLASIGGNYLMGLAAASASGLSFLAILLLLPNLPPKQERQPGRMPLVNFSLLRDVTSLRRLFLLASVSWFSLACLEGTFGRLIKAKLGYAQAEFGIVFSFEALVGAVAGLLLGALARRFRPKSLLQFGYVLLGFGVMLTPFAGVLASQPWFAAVVPPFAAAAMVALFISSFLWAFGLGIANPTLNTLCSSATPEARQGEMFGLLQAARSAGFIVGPIIGGQLFDVWHEGPYLLAGAVALLAALFAASVPSGETKGEPLATS